MNLNSIGGARGPANTSRNLERGFIRNQEAPAQAAGFTDGWSPPSGGQFPRFRQVNRGLNGIAAAVRSGDLPPSQIAAAVARLARPTDREIKGLWTPAGAAVRHENMAAWINLAKVAPRALLPPNPTNGYRQSVGEASIVVQFNNALMEGNKADVRDAAAIMARRYRSSPFNQGIQAQAQRMLQGD